MTRNESIPPSGGTSQVFDGFARTDAAIILGACSEQSLPAGAQLFGEGETGGSLWIVKSGRVEVFTRFGSEEERILDVMSRDDVVGELAFLDPAARSASARAAEPSSFLVLTVEAFKGIELLRPDLAVAFYRNIARILAVRLRRTTLLYRDEVEFGLQTAGAAALNLLSLSTELRTVDVHLTNGAVLGGRLILVDHHQAGYSLILRTVSGSTQIIPYHAVLWIEPVSAR